MSYYIAQNQSGPFPQTYDFDLPIDGDVTIAFSATCWSTAANSVGGIILYLDGNYLADVPFYFNAASMHMTLPTQFLPVSLSFGKHSITLQPLNATTVSDGNDYFSLWILE